MLINEEGFESIENVLEDIEQITLTEGILDVFKKNPDKIIDDVIENYIIQDYKYYQYYYQGGPGSKFVPKWMNILKTKPNSDEEFFYTFKNLVIPMLINYESGELALAIIERSKSEHLTKRLEEKVAFSCTLGSNTFTLDSKDILDNKVSKVNAEKNKFLDVVAKFVKLRNLGEQTTANLNNSITQWRNPVMTYIPGARDRVLEAVQKVKKAEQIYNSK